MTMSDTRPEFFEVEFLDLVGLIEEVLLDQREHLVSPHALKFFDGEFFIHKESLAYGVVTIYESRESLVQCCEPGKENITKFVLMVWMLVVAAENIDVRKRFEEVEATTQRYVDAPGPAVSCVHGPNDEKVLR